jgi:hypothetical protein
MRAERRIAAAAGGERCANASRDPRRRERERERNVLVLSFNLGHVAATGGSNATIGELVIA